MASAMRSSRLSRNCAVTSERPVLDMRGQRCPAPVIALARAMRDLPAGTQVHVLADDPAAEYDIPAWCRMKGAQLLQVSDADAGSAARNYAVRLP